KGLGGRAGRGGGRADRVPGAEQRRDGKVHRRQAARRADRAYAALQRREPLFKYRSGGVGDAGVDMSGALEIEQRRRVIGILKDEGSGLIDRNRARPGDGIGMLPRMQGESFKGGGLRS